MSGSQEWVHFFRFWFSLVNLKIVLLSATNTLTYFPWSDRYALFLLRKCLPNTQLWIILVFQVKCILWGKKVQLPARTVVQVLLLKRATGLQLQPESCVQTWFHHRIQRQVSPRSRFVGIVIFLHNRPSEVKFTFLLHMPSGWEHRDSSWSLVPCLPWGPPTPIFQELCPPTVWTTAPWRRQIKPHIMMKMTLTLRGPRGPSGTMGHTLRTAALQENILLRFFRIPCLHFPAVAPTVRVAPWEHCSCTSGNGGKTRTQRALSFCGADPTPSTDCLSVSHCEHCSLNPW